VLSVARPAALLVVNPHAGASHVHHRRHTEYLVALLAERGLVAAVCAEPDQAAARRRVRAAVQAGCPLVIAAGGDGTVEAAALDLVNTQTALGIVPLGTYNNLAASLHIPSDVQAACALVATGQAHPIDVGEVRAHGLRGARVFLEQATVGLGPLLAPVGEDLEKGHWIEALRALPAAVRLKPVPMRIAFGGGGVSWDAETLLVTICNAPRSAAAFVLAPDARMDDGQLDVCVYDGLHQAQLATRVFEFITGGVKDQPGARRSRAAVVEIFSADHSGQRLSVAADAEVIGETPARFRVIPGALRVIVPRPDAGPPT
jgi:diacylglycerol kinase (ATP)